MDAREKDARMNSRKHLVIHRHCPVSFGPQTVVLLRENDVLPAMNWQAVLGS